MRRQQGRIRERSEGAWELRHNLGADPATVNERGMAACRSSG